MGYGEIIKWEPDGFRLENTSIWSFPERGNWATHDGNWRGNWSPYIPRNLILRYSREKDWLLDQFAGGGTTIVEAKLLNRNIIGVDVNEIALERCREKSSFEQNGADGQVRLRKGDARNLNFIRDESIDLICTHPPYADIIQYSDSIESDLSRLTVPEFLREMEKVATESYRVLRLGKTCAVLMGDIRKNGYIIPLSFEVMKVFEKAGFKLKELVVKEQHNCRSTGYWNGKNNSNDFLMIAHEHLLIFKK